MQIRLSTEERHAEIVAAAAWSLSRDRSPALITTSAIASAEGVTPGAEFKHFTTEEAICLAAMTRVAVLLTWAQASGAGGPRECLAGERGRATGGQRLCALA